MNIEPSDIGEDDFLSKYRTTPIHKTNILPLRWFAKFCNCYPAAWAMRHALYYEDKADYLKTDLDKAGYRWWKAYNILNAPYKKWGTLYELHFD